MPYIRQNQREELEGSRPMNVGQLNYVITRAAVRFLGSCPTYTDFNAVIGVLECAKQELYRRMIAPYEDDKKKENGDVYK